MRLKKRLKTFPARLRERSVRNWQSIRYRMHQVMPSRRAEHGMSLPVIVSLTSHPPRFRTLIHTLHALLLQDTRPDIIELCLAEHEAALLPREILALRDADLIVLRIADNLGPYKKLIPVREARPDALIAIADDDLWYTPSWLRKLLEAKRITPDQIVCHRAHVLRFGPDGRPLPYLNWDINTSRNEAGLLVLPTGGAGVLYGPDDLHPDVLDPAKFKALCPTSDDIWFYWMGNRAGTLVRKVGPPPNLMVWYGSQRQQALWVGNSPIGGGNDIAVAAMVEAYGLPKGVAAPT